MKRVLQFSENQIRNEMFSCIRHLLSAIDEIAVMRTFLYQTALLQGAVGGLIGINPSLSTQPGSRRSDFLSQSVGIIESELFTRSYFEISDGGVDSWDVLVSVAIKLGWSPSEPRFSKSFGTVGAPNFCQIFGYSIRSNFGDVLGFVIYASSEPDPFILADRNTTLIAELSIFRLLEMVGVRQCAFRKTGDSMEFYETTGSMFPAIDDVYARSIHDLNGVLATVAMQSQMIVHERSEAEKVNARTQKILTSLQQAEKYMNRSDSMTRIFNGRVEPVDFSDLVDLASVTGALQPISELAIVADSPTAALPESPIEKLMLFFLCHNVVRLMTIRAQTSTGRSESTTPKVTLTFSIVSEEQIIEIMGTLPADPEVDLNTELARNERDYQLGRRINPPRKILGQVLSMIGGTLLWETVGSETRLIMRVPARYVQSRS